MLFLLSFLSTCLLVPSLAAPAACEPGAFCYQAPEGTRVTVTRAGDVLSLKLVDEKGTSLSKNVTFSQNGVENLVNCQANGNDNTCQAQIAVDRFDKNLPINVTLPESTQPVSFNLAALTPPPQEGLTKQQRRQFSKAHAILMILGWLFFVPTGFLFARLGKDLFKEQTLFGMAVWFQIHRAANFMGVVCICTSMLCIFISQQWTWKGSWSGSKYWTEVHTDLGVISSVLAVAQPINSLLRCGPTHSKRVIFNWAHRCVGIIAFSLALTAIIIAAVQFKRIWNEPLLELVLVCLPIVICLTATIVFSVLESDRFKGKASFGPHILKAPVIFWAIGVFFCIAVALSLLVVNGYKNT